MSTSWSKGRPSCARHTLLPLASLYRSACQVRSGVAHVCARCSVRQPMKRGKRERPNRRRESPCLTCPLEPVTFSHIHLHSQNPFCTPPLRSYLLAHSRDHQPAARPKSITHSARTLETFWESRKESNFLGKPETCCRRGQFGFCGQVFLSSRYSFYSCADDPNSSGFADR